MSLQIALRCGIIMVTKFSTGGHYEKNCA